MWKKVKHIWNNWSSHGLKLPYAFDQDSKKPSLTLLIFYVMFLLSVSSLIALHFDQSLWIATGYTLFGWVLAFVFYKLRRLDNVKLNIKEGEVELDSDDDK